jgi:hypothetical protein
MVAAEVAPEPPPVLGAVPPQRVVVDRSNPARAAAEAARRRYPEDRTAVTH